MNELYLIAHKVYGEPAFDIATKIFVEDINEYFWIIPTSGHRAYPYWFVSLDNCMIDTVGDLSDLSSPTDLCPPMPPDAIEHYRTSTALSTKDKPAKKGKGAKGFGDLISLIGMKKEEKITRRF